MKFIFLTIVFLSSVARANPACLSPEKADMPKSDDLQIPKSQYSVGICYLSEKDKNGQFKKFHDDLIVLKKNGTAVVEGKTKSSVTDGRVAGLVLEKATERFVAVTYDAGEFCNGLMIFDTKKNRIAHQSECVKSSDICHVVDLNEKKCQAKIECRDEGAEGAPPERKEVDRQTVMLCQ